MLKMLERLVTFSLIQLAMGSFSVLILGTELHEHLIEQADTRKSLGISITYALVYTGCALFALLYYKRVLAAMLAAWPFVAVALLATISTFWSIDPEVTVRRSVVLLGSTVYGTYLGHRYSVRQFEKVLIQSFLLLTMTSIVVLAMFPAYVLDPSHRGAFRGLTQHKNLFGEYMGMFLLLAITYTPRRGPIMKALLILFAAAMLAASQSGTSLLSTAVTALVLPLLFLLRFPPKQMFPLGILGSALVSLLIYLSWGRADAFLDLLGKDRTFTGRSIIWQMVTEAILRRPWLGYGFDAFWQGLKGESLLIIASADWLVPHSHNGYLEALLGLGFVGLFLVLLCAGRLAVHGAAYLRQTEGLEGFWPLAFLVYFLVHAMGEPSLLTRDYLSYLVFITVSTSLALRRAQSAMPDQITRKTVAADYIWPTA